MRAPLRQSLFGLALSLGLSACATAPAKQSFAAVEAGDYSLDKSHASLIFQVKHMGLSWYTMRFDDFDASLNFDKENPENSTVSAVINPRSINANHPTKDDWDEELAMDERFLLAGQFPDIVFKSTTIERTGEFTGIMTGDLTLLGVTKPVSMDVTFNGANTPPWAPGKTYVGFSAEGNFDRTDFGMTSMAPNPVSAEVRFQIEVEFAEGG